MKKLPTHLILLYSCFSLWCVVFVSFSPGDAFCPVVFSYHMVEFTAHACSSVSPWAWLCCEVVPFWLATESDEGPILYIFFCTWFWDWSRPWFFPLREWKFSSQEAKTHLKPLRTDLHLFITTYVSVLYVCTPCRQAQMFPDLMKSDEAPF